MATNRYYSNGVDFDDLFEPYSSGNKAQASGRRIDGADLSERYQARGDVQKRADIGHRVGGTDLSNLWLAKGSVTISRGGVPDNINSSIDVPGSQGATTNSTLQYQRDGVVYWQGDATMQGQGNWISVPASNSGDSYDVMYTVQSGSGGTLSGTTGQWLQVSQTRSVSLQVTGANLQNRSGSRVINVQFRRRSDNAVLLNYNVTLFAAVNSSQA